MSNKLVVKQGEAKTITFTVKDALGTGVDLSGAVLVLGVKKDKSEADYTFSKADEDFDKSQAANGIVAVNLTATDTNQPEAAYIGELRCAWPGPVIKKSEDFFLQIKKAVTA
jgi:ribosomal protein S11